MHLNPRRGGASPLYGFFGLMLVFSPMFGPSEALVFPQYNQMADMMFASRIALLVCFILSCSLFLYFDKLTQKGKRNVILVSAALCAVSMVFTSLPALGFSERFLIVGAVLRGLGYGVLALAWVFNLTKLRGNGIGVALSESLLFYGFACSVTTLAASASPVFAAILLVIWPVASGLACAHIEQITPPRNVSSRQEPLSKFGQGIFALCNFTYGIAFGILLNSMRSIESLPISVEFTLTAAVLTLVFLAYGRASDYARGLRIYSLIAAFALLICTLVDNSLPLATPYLVTALWACQIFFSNLVFIDAEFSVPGISHAAGGVALGILGLGVLVAALLPSSQPATIDLTTFVASTFCCIVFLAGIFLPSGQRGSSVFGFSSYTLPESEESILNRRCEEISAQFKLTKRESEIAQLLAQGLHTNAISDQLFISPLTAKTHLRNIYSKTNVHSQEEFRELLFEGESPAPAKEIEEEA